MLEKIASKFQTAVLIGLVTLLSAVFVIQFGGPQAEGCTAGGASYAVRVYGKTVSEGDFRASYVLAGFNRYPIANQRALGLRQAVVDGFVERALLARVARELGFRVSEDDVMKRLASRGTVLFSLGQSAPASYRQLGEIPIDVKDANGEFDPERAKQFIQNYLRRSVGEFAEAQIEETLAKRMRETIQATVVVSPQEVWDAFVRETDRAQIKYVRFTPGFYADTVDTSEQEIQRWMKANEKKLDTEYKDNLHRFTNLEPQVRARHILIKVASDADAEVKETARARIETALTRARAGADFANLAKEFSEDSTSKKGGDLGYNPRGRMVAEFDKVQFSLKPGEVSDVVETQFGFHIIKVEDKREGDVPKAEAKRELANELYREASASKLAQKAATVALDAVRTGTTWDELQGQFGSREDTPLAPQVTETTEFGRTDSPIQGPFDSGPLVQAAFAQSVEDPLPKQPIQLGNDYFIFGVQSRVLPEKEKFTADTKERLMLGLMQSKQRETLNGYITGLRKRAESSGDVAVSPSILLYGDEKKTEGAADDTETAPAK